MWQIAVCSLQRRQDRGFAGGRQLKVEQAARTPQCWVGKTTAMQQALTVKGFDPMQFLSWWLLLQNPRIIPR